MCSQCCYKRTFTGVSQTDRRMEGLGEAPWRSFTQWPGAPLSVGLSVVPQLVCCHDPGLCLGLEWE